MSSSLSVTAASAAAVLQASSEPASGPLISLRFNSAIKVRSNPIASLRWARRRTYAQLASIPSSGTFRNQPPNTGSQ